MYMKRYFAVFGKKIFREYEVASLWLQNMEYFGDIAVFDLPAKLDIAVFQRLSQVIKSWYVVSYHDIWDEIKKSSDILLFGTANKDLGIRIKKEFGLRRFKTVDIGHSDLEIMQKWVEVVCMSKWQDVRWIVQKSQNIDFFEQVDFGKPLRWMQIWMMPAKLTLLLVNLATMDLQKKSDDITVRDPFCGFGTTGFVVNSLGYSFIGSDINATPIKSNLKRWLTNTYRQDKPFTIFKQDISADITSPLIRKVDSIATEWRLGPLIHSATFTQHLQENYKKISDLYFKFIENISKFDNIQKIVFTVPFYTKLGLSITDNIMEHASSFGFHAMQIPELYHRKWQQIWREIVMLSR